MPTRVHSRFVPEEDIHVVSDWNFEQVDRNASRFAAKLQAQALAEEQARNDTVRRAGYNEGYSVGYSQGHAQATQEGNQKLDDYVRTAGADVARQLGQLITSAHTQVEEAQQVMARGVLDLACELARQVLRHELGTNPNALHPVIREALGALTLDSKTAVVRLNPQDLEVLADVIRQEFSGLSLTLLADDTLARGGCLIESAGMVVDATVQKRWQRAVARLGLEHPWELPDADH